MADNKTRLDKGGNKLTHKTTGVGTGAFHPRAFLDLGGERCPEGFGMWTCGAGHRRVANNVELYPVFFLLPTTVGSSEPIALFARQIR